MMPFTSYFYRIVCKAALISHNVCILIVIYIWKEKPIDEFILNILFLHFIMKMTENKLTLDNKYNS